MSRSHALAMVPVWRATARMTDEELRVAQETYVAEHFPGETLDQVIARAAAANAPRGLDVPEPLELQGVDCRQRGASTGAGVDPVRPAVTSCDDGADVTFAGEGSAA